MIDSQWKKEISLLQSVVHLMGLSDNPLFRRCGADEETSAHILCEYEALASLGHVYPSAWNQGH